MLNIHKVEHVYLAVGTTDLRKSIDGLSAIVCSIFKMDTSESSVFVFCNRKRDKLKILHWDNGFWLYYYRVERGQLKWPHEENSGTPVDINIEEFSWLLKGYEVRTHNKLTIKNTKIIY